MAQKESQKRGRRATAKPSIEDRAEAIAKDVYGYDADTRRHIEIALLTPRLGLAELVERAERGEFLVESGVPPEYDEAARAVIALLDMQSGIHESITGAVQFVIDELARETGAGIWIDMGNDSETGNYSPAILARVFHHHQFLRVEVERKKDLAGLISAVLNHPDLPCELQESIGGSINDLFNDLPGGVWKRVEYSPEYLSILLRTHGETKGAESN
ncbi:MAG: hypothetical protein WCD76_02625 [Pyrinomonadaceae bacterium]